MKNYLYGIVIVIVAFIIAPKAFAAELFFKPLTGEIGIGQQFTVGVFLDSKQEYINALDVNIQYSRELIAFKNWHDGNSVINLWVQQPYTENEIISFEGVIPGGYWGEEGLLLTLSFKGTAEGEGMLSFLESTRIFLNDGQGTQASTLLTPHQFIIHQEEPITEQIAAEEDNYPPEPFTPQVVRDPSMFDGKWFLVFATQDKGSGVARYEVREVPQIILWFTRWRSAESPYVLRDQSLRSTINVRAVDNAGNRQEISIPAAYPERPIVRYSLLIVVGCAILLIIWRRLSRRR